MIVEDFNGSTKLESTKKSYSEPKLELIGDVSELTEGAFGTKSDGSTQQPPISQ